MTDASRREQQPAQPDDGRMPPADVDALGTWPPAEAEVHAPPAEPPTSPEGDPMAGAPDQPPAGTPAGDELPADARSREELLAALVEAEQARDEYLDGMQRARAEFDNFRRRTMREGASQRELGKAEVIEGQLEALDDVDRTLDAAAASSDEGLAKGVQLVAEKLVGALRAAGLERIDQVGVRFDPNHHEAVQQTPADEPRDEPVVTQVLRPGYVLGERVLRAAMVVVEQ